MVKRANWLKIQAILLKEHIKLTHWALSTKIMFQLGQMKKNNKNDKIRLYENINYEQVLSCDDFQFEITNLYKKYNIIFKYKNRLGINSS